ncbi:MAG TPA: hypothetical protein VK610_02940 [Rhodothermales bacterium]|nr:hypothetical protein [Rhodothermales bacterium]
MSTPPPAHAERAVLVFLDGVGLGAADPAVNPLTAPRPAFARLAGGHAWTADAPTLALPTHVFRPVDATFGVDGLPQSGTGQAALFGGFDAPTLAGRHFGPYPPSKVRPTLAETNMFSRLLRAGTPVEELAFANAFPERYFRYVEALEAKGKQRRTATTFCCAAAGVRLRTRDDFERGDAIAADLAGASWPEARALTPTTPAESGRCLARITAQHRLTLFEFWLTDKAGHSRDRPRADEVLDALDFFLKGLLDAMGDDTLLVISSDHGNLEDLSTKTHTRNPVPLIAYGPGSFLFNRAHTLADVTPALVEALGA